MNPKMQTSDSRHQRTLSAASVVRPLAFPFSKEIAPWIKRFTFALLTILFPLYAYKVHLKQDYTDFSVYHLAAKRSQSLAWDQVYNLLDGASPFRYAPPWLVFFRPFAALTLPQAQLLWYFFQFGFFSLGFYWIYQSLRLVLGKSNSDQALTVTCIGILFILRFCLDSFTIGQVSSLMFFGFSLSTYFWIRGNALWTTIGLFGPTALKIGPGFLFGIFLSSRTSRQQQAFRTLLVLLLIFLLTPSVLHPTWDALQSLWSSWVVIVQNDSVYFDSSHYGSQSIHSFFLRSIKHGWLSAPTAERLELLTKLWILCSVLLIWSLRRAKSFLGRGLFISLGLFVYMGVMPETFKYSLTPLMIPFVFLCVSQSKQPLFLRFLRVSMMFATLTLSLAGKDIVGNDLFFSLQNRSVPLFAVFLLGICTAYLAWEESSPSPLAKKLGPVLWRSETEFPLWPERDPIHLKEEGRREVSVLIPIALGPGHLFNPDSDPQALQQFLQNWRRTLQSEVTKRPYEILIIFWDVRVSHSHPMIQATHALISTLSEEQSVSVPVPIRMILTPWVTGQSSAIRAGFLESRGDRLIVANFEQPINADFLPHWLQAVHTSFDQGKDLIRGNRRLLEGHFKIPVRFLAMVYRRHQLGLALNAGLRLLLGLKSQDTASPYIAFTRRLGAEAFAAQHCRGALFNVELSLICKNFNYQEHDLPISVQLKTEKSLSRVFWESIEIIFDLSKIVWRSRNGSYQPTPELKSVTADDWGLSPGVNDGILKLARIGVVRRVSILANGAFVGRGIDELKAIPGIELGLHFNLTYGRALHDGSPLISSPARFLISWLHPKSNPIGTSGETKRVWVEAEFRSQLKRLQELHVPLHYLDGHHHIHLVPGLIQAIAQPAREAGIRQIRIPWDTSLWRTPQFPLLILSALARRPFARAGFESLPCYYPSPQLIRNHAQFRRALGVRLKTHAESEIIVHPADENDLESLEFPDSYQVGRVSEFLSLRMLRAQKVCQTPLAGELNV